jgi:RNA polymerase sigma factor (sigma-70 family)
MAWWVLSTAVYPIQVEPSSTAMNSTNIGRETVFRIQNEEALFGSKRSTPGMRQAWELAARSRPRLMAQAVRVCRNTSDAEDLVQETLLRFARAFGDVEPLPNSKLCEAWLVTTLTRLFYDQCRRRKAQSYGAAALGMSVGAVVEQEPASRPVFEAITDEQFAQALHALSPRLRATIELHAAGKRYRDIARILDIPTGTVAKRLYDARARLYALLLPLAGVGLL